ASWTRSSPDSPTDGQSTRSPTRTHQPLAQHSSKRQCGRVTGSPPRVELRNVTKTYGPVRALVNVSAAFEGGKVTAVTGPNGSGKSTLLSLVGTLARPTSGKVLHGALGHSRKDVRAALGWVGHASLCYGDLTGRENIELAARLHGID